MTTQSAEAAIIIRGRNESQRAFNEVSSSLSGVERTAEKSSQQVSGSFRRMGSAVAGFQGRLSMMTGVLSGIGVGALIGFSSIESVIAGVVGRFQKSREESERFTDAFRRAQVQVSLSGFTISQFNENVQILERTLGRIATTSILQSAEAVKLFGEETSDTVRAIAIAAQNFANVFGTETTKTADFAVALQKAIDGNFTRINEILGLSGDAAIRTQEQFANLVTDIQTRAEAIDPGRPIAESIGAGLRRAFEIVAQFNFVEAFGKLNRQISGWISDTVGDFLEGLGIPVANIFSADGPIAAAIRTFFEATLGRLVNFGGLISKLDLAKGLFTGTVIKEWITDIRDFIENVVSSFKTIFSPEGPRFLGTLLAQFAAGAWLTLWDRMTSPIRSFVGIAVGIIETLMRVDLVNAVVNSIGSFGKTVFQFLANPFIAAVNAIINAWNRLSFRLPGFSVFGQTIGGFEIGTPNIPTIPSFQAGGIVPGSPGAPTLAMLHGGERVLSRADSRSGVVINLTIVTTDGRLIRQEAVEGVREAFVNAGIPPGAFKSGI